MPGSLQGLKEMLHVLDTFIEFATVHFEVTKESLLDLFYSFQLLVLFLKWVYLIFYLNYCCRIYDVDTFAVNDAIIIKEFQGLRCTYNDFSNRTLALSTQNIEPLAQVP